jgi:hypothetical protein
VSIDTANALDPAAVMQRLSDIEADLGLRLNDYTSAAGDAARLVREWEYRLAVARTKAQGPDTDARKAAALVMAITQDDLYDRLKEAEGEFAASRAAVFTLEKRAMIGLGILKGLGRG